VEPLSRKDSQDDAENTVRSGRPFWALPMWDVESDVINKAGDVVPRPAGKKKAEISEQAEASEQA
jgi:hypothetical protein